MPALERMHVLRLLDPTIGRSGIFKGERIISVLRDLIGDCDIEALPISYTAVATDLYSGQEGWLRSGNLFDAIRSLHNRGLISTVTTASSRPAGAMTACTVPWPTTVEPTSATARSGAAASAGT